MKKIIRPLSSALITLILIASFIVPFLNPGTAYATSWYNTSWAYRDSFAISRASGAVTNYQFPLKIYYGSGANGTEAVEGITAGKLYCTSHCQADFDDIRVTTSDGVTLLDYWVESKTDSNNEVIWIEFDSIGTGATTFYVYWGNAGASAQYATTHLAGVATFISFEDFEWGSDGDSLGTDGGSIDWTVTAAGNAKAEIDTGQYWGGIKAGRFFSDASNAPITTMAVTAADNSYAIRYRLRKEDAPRVFIPHGNGSYRILEFIDENENINLRNIAGTDVDTGTNVTADTWGLFEHNNLDFTNHTQDLWFNGSKIADNYELDDTATYSNQLGFTGNTTNNGTFWIDNVIVRNWRSTEPAWGAWGTEETGIPTVTTQAATSVEETTATGNGNITSLNGGANATVQGIQYDTDSGAPYASDAHNTGSYGTGAFTVSLTGLTKGELYYARAYATNPMGTGYGAEVTFLTKPDEPNTFAAAYASDTSIDLSWAKGTGAQKTIIRAKLNSYPANIADGTGIYNDTGVSYEHTGLTLGDHWYYRAWSYATEGGLEQWSDAYAEVNLILANTTPAVTTLPRTGFNQTWAILNGQMTDDKGYAITSYGIQYGLTDGLGTTVTTAGTLDDNDKFFKRLSGLRAATIYYYRAFAVNSEGTGYGSTERFATKGSPAVYEYYITGQDDDSLQIYGANWAYQTFQVDTVAHTITSVRLYLKRTGSPGDVTVEIRHASSDVPTGVAIASTTIDGDTMVSTGYSMIQFNLTEKGYEASTDYSIVVYCLDGDGSNYIEWGTNSAGGYADGVYGTSTDGGVSWADTADDTIFEVWGNPCIEIQDVKVFTGYKETGDWLVTVRFINVYPPYYDTYDIRKYFTLDLLDLSSVVRGSTPLTAWGNRVASLYLSAAQVGALETGKAYTVRIYGLFGANPYTDYVLQPADYQGADLTNLDSWVISCAGVISSYYNTSMTTYIANKGEVLNSTGGTVMANGISGLATVRPGIFQTASAAGGHTDTPQNQTGVEANPQAIVGPQVWSWVTNLGAPVGADGRQILMILFVGFYLIFAIWAFVPGQSVAANILGLPMILGATLFGMSFIYVVILCVVSGFLFVKHFWIDKRA